MDENTKAAIRILDGAAAIFQDPGTWCQFMESIDDRGYATTLDRGVSFCLSGAIRRTATKLDPRGGRAPAGQTEAYIALVDQIGERDITTWNDRPERTIDEVRSVLRRAVAELAREGR